MKKLEHLLAILDPYHSANINIAPLGMMMYKNKNGVMEWACDIQIEGPVNINVSGTGDSFAAAVRSATREFQGAKNQIDQTGTTQAQRATHTET